MHQLCYFINKTFCDVECLMAYSGITEGRNPVAVLPEGKEPDFVVPSWLKNRWKLTLGKSQEVLEPLLDEVGEIDIFIHDSEHSYENMYFEFKTSWHHLRSNGPSLSHDITQNRAFLSTPHPRCAEVGFTTILQEQE